LAELLVVSDGELLVARHDTVLLVIAGCVSGEFEELCGEIFWHGGETGWCVKESKRVNENSLPGAPAPTCWA
jgi:hypothetical protein